MILPSSTIDDGGRRITLKWTEVSDSGPIVMFLTGDGPKGSRSQSWTNLPPMLAERNISSMLFDFTGLGDSDGERADLTLDVGRQNFQAAYRAMREVIGSRQVAIFSSSFGSAVALSCPDILNDVRAHVMKSPAFWLAEAYANELDSASMIGWANGIPSDQVQYRPEVLYSSLSKNSFTTAADIFTSCQIIHGSADEIIPLWQSIAYTKLYGGPVDLHIVSGATHSYSEPGAWDEMAHIAIDFLSGKFR